MRLRRQTARAKKVDPAALECLYRHHFEFVYRKVAGMVRGDRTVIDDLVHDTFEKMAITYADELAGMVKDQVQRLLTTIARSCVVDHWRKDGKIVFWKSYTDADVSFHPMSSAGVEKFDEMLDTNEVMDIFTKVAAHLTDAEWRVSFMTWVMDKTDEEIAAILGTTVKTIRTHRCSARKKIKAWAEQDGREIICSESDAEQGAPASGIGEVTV